MMAIDVRIDRIVVHGGELPMPSSDEISRAIQVELAKLIAATPRSAWNRSRRVVRADASTLAPVASNQLGRIAGQALHRVVLGEGNRP